MFESLCDAAPRRAAAERHRPRRGRSAHVVKAIGKGLLKILSKMGISTIRSYSGAQIFEAVGLDRERRRPPLHRHAVAHRRRRPRRARPRGARPPRARLPGRRVGAAARRRRLRRGAATASATAGTRRRSPSSSTPRAAREPRRLRAASAPSQRRRGEALDAARAAASSRDDVEPVPLDEVEPAKEIVKRFTTGGMSLGALSPEAHETLAVAMNRLGGKSNTGEGGEDPRALHRRAPLVDQAGRLGPLRRDDRLPRQRRRAPDQGRPGRQARRGRPAARPQGRRLHRAAAPLDARASALISPPPHHDIYSIEDLKQLIYDLRCANPQRARLGQARLRGRRRHGRRRRRQGERRPRRDRRPRRRHRRVAAVVDPATPACRGRSAWPRPSRRCSRNDLRSRIVVETDGQHAHRPRRGHRGAARRRRVRLLDRPADRARLRHDARLPPQHLPGRRRDPGPGAARALRRHSPSTSSTT